MALRVADREADSVSGWSLGQILQELGRAQDDIPIVDAEGKLVASWSHRSRALADAVGRILITPSKEQFDAPPRATLERTLTPPRIDVVEAPDLLTGGEPWRGRHITLNVEGTAFTWSNNELRNKDGALMARSDAGVPLHAVAAVAAWSMRPQRG